MILLNRVILDAVERSLNKNDAAFLRAQLLSI